MRNKEGDILVFPVQNQQKVIRTAGWSNFIPSFDLYLCAVGERFTAVSLPPPIISLSDGSSSVSCSTGIPSEWELLNRWVGTRGGTEVYDSLLGQLHRALLTLVGHYYDRDSVLYTSDDFQSWGLKSDAKWSDGLISLDLPLSKLIYTKHALPDRSYQVSFTDRLLNPSFPFFKSVLPTSDGDNPSRNTVIGSWESGSGSLSTFNFPNQRVLALLNNLKSWCKTGWFQPCFSERSIMILPSEEGSDFLPAPENFDDLILHDKVVTFDLVNLCPQFRYFLCSTNPSQSVEFPLYYKTYSDNRGVSPYTAQVKELWFNGVLVPQMPFYPWDITHLLRCGSNTLRVVYYGSYSWTDITLCPLLPVDNRFVSTTNSIRFSNLCWKPLGVNDWMNWQLNGDHTLLRDDTISFSEYNVRHNPFNCKPASSELTSGRSDISVIPQNPLLNQQVLIEFSKPVSAKKYTAYFQVSDTLQYGDGTLMTKEIGSGDALDRTSFYASLPIDCNMDWRVKVVFDDGSQLLGEILNYGAFFAEGTFATIPGSLGAGTGCSEACLPVTGEGECISVLSFDNPNVKLSTGCNSCRTTNPQPCAINGLFIYVVYSATEHYTFTKGPASGKTVTAPCYGAHQCDAALFDFYAGDSQLGQVNLNNLSDGGSRESGPFYISSDVVKALAAKNNNPEEVIFKLVCALKDNQGWGTNTCHTSAPWVYILGDTGLEIYNGCPYTNSDGSFSLRICSPDVVPPVDPPDGGGGDGGGGGTPTPCTVGEWYEASQFSPDWVQGNCTGSWSGFSGGIGTFTWTSLAGLHCPDGSDTPNINYGSVSLHYHAGEPYNEDLCKASKICKKKLEIRVTTNAGDCFGRTTVNVSIDRGMVDGVYTFETLIYGKSKSCHEYFEDNTCRTAPILGIDDPVETTIGCNETLTIDFGQFLDEWVTDFTLEIEVKETNLLK